MFELYWPWWAGALALSSTAVGYLLVTGRPLGISGMWGRVIDWLTHGKEERQAEALLDHADELEKALLAATAARFGQEASKAKADEGCGAPPPDSPMAQGAPVSARVHLVFLLALILGGFLAALASGNFAIQTRMDLDFERILGAGLPGFLALLGGGVLVGLGTRMAGGCTSGHGLSGCGTFQPGSWVATACFFGMGVAVSFLLAWMRG